MNMRESIFLTLMAAVLLASCAGPQALTEADELARFGQHEAAVQRLEQASQQVPQPRKRDLGL